MRSLGKTGSAAILAAFVSLFAWHLGSRGHPFVFPLDDAYIYLEYARTAALGEPGAYVPGAPASTGATSLLWLVGLTKIALLLRLFGAQLKTALPVASLLGCGIALGLSLWLMLRLAARHGVPEVFAHVSWLLVLVSPLWIFGSMNGMETGLYAMTLLGGAWAVTGGSLLWLLPLSLVRPEGAVLALALVAWQYRRTRSRFVILAVVAGALLCLAWPWLLTGRAAAAWEAKALWLEPKAEVRGFYLPRLPYFALRTWWFGLSGARAQPPLDVADAFLRLDAWPVWASAIFLGGGALLALLRGRGRVLVILWAALSLTALLCVAWDAQFYRYLVPSYPLLCVAAVAGWFAGSWKDTRARLGMVLFALAMIGAFAPPEGLGLTMRRLYRGECERMESTQLRVGEWVAENLNDSARVATHDVGAIAWAGERPVVDLVGLVTPQLAGAYRHGEGALWESLDALPAEERPTHMAVVPAWMPFLFRTELLVHRLFSLEPLNTERSPVGRTFEIWSVTWPGQNPDAFPGGDFGNLPFTYGPASKRPDWTIMDELDVADLASERAHAFETEGGTGVTVVRQLGFGFPSQGQFAAAIEGGRDIAGPSRFVLRAHPGDRALLLLRATTVERPDLVVTIGEWTGLVRMSRNEHIFQEAGVVVPSEVVTDRMDITVDGKGYRAFHWWLVQQVEADSQ